MLSFLTSLCTIIGAIVLGGITLGIIGFIVLIGVLFLADRLKIN